ncbi:MAG: TRAP transporter large permease subunit [Faecalibacterium prausnitzii]
MAACGFFGAVSGSGVASAAAIGKIIGPSMLEEGYPKRPDGRPYRSRRHDGLHHPTQHRHGGHADQPASP